MHDLGSAATTTANPILLNTGPSERGAHRLQLALTCPALYAFTRVINHAETRAARDPLVRGSIGHVALAHHYARIGAEQHGIDPRTYYAPEEAIDIVAQEYGVVGARFAPLIHDVYRDYAAHYAVERQEVVAVEVLVDTQVPDPTQPGVSHRFTQRWDLVTRDAAGRLWVTDHKLVSKVDGRTALRYALSIQFTGLVWIASQRWGDAFGGVTLNLLGVGGARPYHFERPRLPIAPDAVRRFPAAVALGEQRIAQVEALADPWSAPRVFSETVCMTSYGPCPCADLCRFGRGYVTMDGRRL